MSKEPKTLADLWFMRETSSGWFDGQIKYDNSMRERVEGGIHSITWCVNVYSDKIRVNKRVERYKQIDGDKEATSIFCDESISYKSLEDFKASEWWEPTMKAWQGGDTDASWFQSFEVNGEKIKDDTWPGYSYRCMELDVGRQYKDWLGNIRQDEGHDRLSISVNQQSGYLELRCGDYEVFGTVEKISHAMLLLTLMEQQGIEVTDEGLSIKFRGGDSNAD